MAVFQLLISEKSGACVNPYDAILLQLNGRAKSVKNLSLFGNCFHKGNTNLLNVSKSIKILIYVN